MAHSIEALAAQYRSSRASAQSAREVMADLYKRYIKEREQSLMDAAAAAAAVNALFLADRIDMSQVTPQMEEAFRLAYPNMNLATLADRSPEQVEGFLSAWKGKYFEVIVRDDLNAGEWVGDIHLNPGQAAVLAESATQPGWDLQILDADGSVAHDIQLKATQSLGYVKEALERYPDIDVLTTDEVLDAGGDAVQGIFSSGFSDSALEDTIHAPMEALLDSPLEELVETVLPGLPFVLITVGEGRQVLMGRKSFELAMQDGLFRAAKTGAAIGVGALVVFLDGGLLSIPASFLTRLGFDRYSVMNRTSGHLEKRILRLQELRQPAMLASGAG
jgi:hypothetical protein